jgi:glutathione-regulated potassium-efflux system ancillary protein KefG
MAKLLIYYAHPGQSHSRVNTKMAKIAKQERGDSFVDLYAQYPRFQIDIVKEQQRLVDHDVILFQFPIFWYSTPSIIKEWQDLVLQQGFAFGTDGDQLANKTLMLAMTAGGPEDAYSQGGYQNHTLRTFLTPFEQTATLCNMQFTSPYVLYDSLQAPGSGEADLHIRAYQQLIRAIENDSYDFNAAGNLDTVSHTDINTLGGQTMENTHG